MCCGLAPRRPNALPTLFVPCSEHAARPVRPAGRRCGDRHTAEGPRGDRGHDRVATETRPRPAARSRHAHQRCRPVRRRVHRPSAENRRLSGGDVARPEVLTCPARRPGEAVGEKAALRSDEKGGKTCAPRNRREGLNTGSCQLCPRRRVSTTLRDRAVPVHRQRQVPLGTWWGGWLRTGGEDDRQRAQLRRTTTGRIADRGDRWDDNVQELGHLSRILMARP